MGCASQGAGGSRSPDWLNGAGSSNTGCPVSTGEEFTALEGGDEADTVGEYGGDELSLECIGTLKGVGSDI